MQRLIEQRKGQSLASTGSQVTRLAIQSQRERERQRQRRSRESWRMGGRGLRASQIREKLWRRMTMSMKGRMFVMHCILCSDQCPSCTVFYALVSPPISSPWSKAGFGPPPPKILNKLINSKFLYYLVKFFPQISRVNAFKSYRFKVLQRLAFLKLIILSFQC